MGKICPEVSETKFVACRPAHVIPMGGKWHVAQLQV